MADIVAPREPKDSIERGEDDQAAQKTGEPATAGELGPRQTAGFEEGAIELSKIEDGADQGTDQTAADKNAELSDQRQLGKEEKRKPDHRGEAAGQERFQEPPEFLAIGFVRTERRLHVEVETVIDRDAGEQGAHDKDENMQTVEGQGGDDPGSQY